MRWGNWGKDTYPVSHTDSRIETWDLLTTSQMPLHYHSSLLEYRKLNNVFLSESLLIFCFETDSHICSTIEYVFSKCIFVCNGTFTLQYILWSPFVLHFLVYSWRVHRTKDLKASFLFVFENKYGIVWLRILLMSVYWTQLFQIYYIWLTLLAL
jgi:hypothetical protein